MATSYNTRCSTLLASRFVNGWYRNQLSSVVDVCVYLLPIPDTDFKESIALSSERDNKFSVLASFAVCDHGGHPPGTIRITWISDKTK